MIVLELLVHSIRRTLVRKNSKRNWTPADRCKIEIKRIYFSIGSLEFCFRIVKQNMECEAVVILPLANNCLQMPCLRYTVFPCIFFILIFSKAVHFIMVFFLSLFTILQLIHFTIDCIQFLLLFLLFFCHSTTFLVRLFAVHILNERS